MKHHRTAVVVVLGAAASVAWASEVIVGAFSKSDVTQWEERVFQGHTEYSLTEEDGRTVLAAHSMGTASSYYRKMEIDLVATPVLNWSWRVDQVFPEIKEREKTGDDYPARIYLVFSPSSSFWKARSLHYVWASNEPVDANWANAYASNAHMIAIDSGEARVGQWQSHKRNVRDDLKEYFGDDIQQVHAIAVMTDTDDTQRSAVAYYGDIFFSKD